MIGWYFKASRLQGFKASRLQGFKASIVENNTRYFEVHTSTSSSIVLYTQIVGNISRK